MPNHPDQYATSQKPVSALAGLFRFMRPDPDIERIADSDTVKRKYRYWRTRVLYSTMIGYALFYFVRKNMSMAMPGIEEEFGITKADLGLFLTLHGVMYGVSKFFNGYLGDQANPRYFMAIGLLGSALMSISFGLSGGVATFGVFWLLNGYFQGMGFPPCARSITHWFSPRERATWLSVWNTSHSIGAAGVLVLGGYLAPMGWRYVFFIPAGIALIGVVFVRERLRDTPPSLGLPPVEEFKGEVSTDAAKIAREKEDSTSLNKFILNHLLKNPLIWYLSIANFFLYVVRYAILDWGPTFLLQEKGIELHIAGWMVAFYEISGIAGMLIGGVVTDRIFKSHAGRASFVYMFLCGVFILLFWLLPFSSRLVYSLLLCGVGFFIYGPQCLVGVIAANLATKRAAATAIGLTGFFAYLSTVLSGYGLGKIVDLYGWNAAFGMLVACAGIACAFFLILWKVNAETEIEGARGAS